MDARRFDSVARSFGADLSRRSLPGWVLALVLGWLSVLGNREELAEAKGRRMRRKKRRQRARSRSDRLRRRRRKRRQRRQRTKPFCRPSRVGRPCGLPGQICQDNGACACSATSCPACQRCNAASGLCEPDPGALGQPCGDAIQICLPGGVCGCPAVGCGGVCGCPAGSICDEGTCQPCDIVHDGSPITSGVALQELFNADGVFRVCPGRYRHEFHTDKKVTLIGAGDGDNETTSTILESSGNKRPVTIEENAVVTLRGLRITGGRGNENGGGIYNKGDLTLIACTVAENETDDYGGGIYFAHGASGSLNLVSSVVTKNYARRGGGIDNNAGSPITIDRSIISHNRSGTDGGGIFNNTGTITISGSEISWNVAQDDGGGINNSSSVGMTTARVTLDAASRVIHNTAGEDDTGTGGGIFNDVEDAQVTLDGATVEHNSPNNCAGGPVVGCVG